ncbi:MAG: DNA polymerase III subunit gamma/tau [Thiotrichaceae bacterium]|nr:DNA polymerase III subunit gamma/tau [Thiotrichaceae bacterium]
MKYQVLARKYRPKTFSAMMGQEHVLKALSNALETERLHHAYLFTGTRGVGKTTVARVLAKALNCEQGISASPCGECASCQEIDQGRFIDLIEVDAASKTKVEDTRELLDNVQYAPTRGRFKIYLIDEVHMLSGHSFNALLKTLEEPPPHAKFLLATTDPQKLPVTILSRCLQFNLKSLTIEQIEQQLQKILIAEEIPFENNVLKPLAIAADGSMRDALSLLDQAIAYSDGKPNLADIEAMLGSVQKDRIFELLNALANEDGRMLVEQSRILAGQGIDVNTILAELISTLQRIALCQMVPDAIDDSLGDKSGVEQVAQLISPEDIQLYYQIAINGRKDLPYSPLPQGGFEMILLRMLAFRPDGSAPRKTKPAIQTQQKPALNANNDSKQSKTQVSTQATFSQGISQGISQAVISDDNDKKIEKKSVSNSNKVKKTHHENQIKSSGPEQMPEDYDLPPIDAYAQDSFNHSSEPPSFVQDVPMNNMGQTRDNTQINHEPELNAPYQAAAQGIQPQRNPVIDTSVYKESSGNKEPSAINEPSADNEPSAIKEPSANREPSANVVPLFKKDLEKVPCAKKNAEELADYWHDLINRSKLDGLEQQLAKHCALVNKTEQNGEQIF